MDMYVSETNEGWEPERVVIGCVGRRRRVYST